jgi:hypothetical protein
MENNTAQTICQAFDQQQYHSKCLSTARANAQAMLTGRTHYVDDSTLRYFNSRITAAQPSTFGLFYRITESCSRSYDGTGRGFRVVLFDLNGQTIYRPDLDSLHSTAAKAEKAFYAWFESFDPLAYYREELTTHARRAHKRAANLEAAIESITEGATA